SEFVEIIRTSGETLLSLINDILDFSKIEADRLELERAPMDICEIARQTLAVLRARAQQKGIQLRHRIDETVPPWVLGDATRLRQVLLNLAGNALKFTEEGEVSLEVRRLELRVADPPSADSGEAMDLHFTVRDSGIGIPPDRLSRLFK